MGQFDQIKNEESVGVNVENTENLQKEAESVAVPSAEELKAKEETKIQNKIVDDNKIKELERDLIGNKEIKEEYNSIGKRILEGPRKILTTMTREEVASFGKEKPNQLPYLESTLRDLNKFPGENGDIVYENLKEYINFLQKLRGEDYSNDILPYSEVQKLRAREDEIRNKIN